ncbi:hypothetical protein J8281_13895 [Aquimarina sp. U1-2]|uniref:hypothetical protein n=1 Tax=Aquimarina sp. U1-2 TaxID=2823141 RepID=UPI001AEC9F4E|nr:hypothetical protein [Aquimarina sp. U1-2]MBP2833282.1 hypothetical protein [Aquimarina sp. U1-2]
MNKKYLKILVFIVFFVGIFFLIKRSKNLALNDSMNGIIENVSIYGGKGDVKVHFTRGEPVILSLYKVKKEDNVEVGDSLFKRIGELVLYHYKKDTSDKFFLYKTYRYSSFFD